MPFVSESKNRQKTVNGNYGYSSVVRDLTVIRSKNQHGYRSYVPEGAVVSDYTNLPNTRAGVISQMALVNMIEADVRSLQLLDRVNPRELSSYESGFSQRNWMRLSTYRDSRTHAIIREDKDPMGCYVHLDVLHNPARLPSWDDIESEASDLMRLSVPSSDTLNLVTLVAELSDYKSYFNAAELSKLWGPSWHLKALKSHNMRRYRASELVSIKGRGLTGLQKATTFFHAMGSIFLSYVFGIKPTTSDAVKAMESVVTLAPRLEEAARGLKAEYRRSRTRVLDDVVLHDTIPIASNVQRADAQGNAIRYSAGYYDTFVHPNINNAMLSIRTFSRTEVKSFSTFEQFIARPQGFLDRLAIYNKLAIEALGGGFDTTAAWEISPWSWLIDWFADVGGLLAYQEILSSNSMYARRSGYVVNQDTVSFARLDLETKSTRTNHGWYYTDHDQSYPSVPVARATRKNQIRRPGGPYSIQQAGVTTPQQTAILGALGLVRLR